MTAMTLAEAAAHISSTDPRFAVAEAEIRGVRHRIFANAPPHLPALMRVCGPAHASGDYLVYENERWTYAAFQAEAERMAAALSRDLGLRPGERVALAMRNYPELLILVMAIAAAGGVTVFLNAWWTEDELEYAFTDSGAKIVFADAPRLARIEPFAEKFDLKPIAVRDAEAAGREGYAALRDGAGADAPAPDIAADDDFAVMYSSGTTGAPKGVALTHRGAISAVFTWLMAGLMAPLMEDAAPAPDEAETPVILIVTPLFHVTATHPMFLLSLPTGARIVLLRKWDPEDAIRVINEERVTRFLGVPTQSAELMEAAARSGAAMPTLSYVGAGGAKRPAAQVARLAEAFPGAVIASGWGMTETNAVGLGISGADYEARPDAAGRLLPPLQDVKIIDGDGREVPTGAIGELTVKSPANMRCYLNQPEATAETLRDGWLRTGDLATIDADGYISIVDRKKSIIIRGGENISCLDVEGALHRHPGVAEACVFPVPDPRLGEIVGACVTVRGGAMTTASDLVAFLEGRIAKYKAPERIWLRRDPLPRGATDKIDRRVLRAQCLADDDAAQTRSA